jgi:hypothetical protein
MINLVRLREQFTSEGILIAFNGAFSHSLIEELGNAAKSYLELEQIKPQTIIDVFAVYIEQTQNAKNYTRVRKLREHQRSSALVVISHAGGEYRICSGNYIHADDVPDLSGRLQEIESLDKAGLRQLYKRQLRRETPPGATGAGVGLIDMARRASAPLVYEFHRDDDQFQFFTLEARVAGE